MAKPVDTRRSQREWIVRALFALVVLIAGFWTVRQTLAALSRTGDPEQAYRLAPTDGRNAAALAQQALAAAAAGGARSRPRLLAQEALRLDPTTVSAVSVYGLDAQMREDAVGARAAFAYAQQLSRRDLQTQLWAIEDAVGRGDIPSVLLHYDVALRTSRRATDILFPVLGSAITNPAVRAALIRTLGSRPAWQNDFISFVSTKGADPEATAALFMGLRAHGHRVSDEATAAVTTALVRRGSAETAWRYYASVRSKVDRSRSRDPNFQLNLAETTPFDWTPVNDDGASASLQSGDTGGVLNFTAPSGVGGTVLRQQQLLPPGIYRISGVSSGINSAETALPYWVLQCSDGRELGRVTIPAQGNFSGMLTVPSSCRMQMLNLMVRSSDMIAGISGQISRAELRPAQRGR